MNVFMEPIVKLYFFFMILISFCGKYVHLESSILLWPVPLAHYKIGKLNIASLMGFLIMFFFGYELEEYLEGMQYMYWFFEQPNTKGNHAWNECEAFKCYHILNWFFLPKTWFLEFIWNFSGRNHLKINTSHPNLTK